MFCQLCNKGSLSSTSDYYGYRLCDDCVSSLGLHKDATIQKNIAVYEKKRQAVPENPTYRQDVEYRLKFIEEDYKRKRIKLLHILDGIGRLE